MQRITGQQLEQIKHYFESAAEIALEATCQRAKCGSVIVKDGKVIGAGYNSPPLDDENRRSCNLTWDYNKKPKYDLTCCVHAEWRAVINACKQNPEKIDGSRLYFMRINETGDFTEAGEPFCTVCSRIAMDSGVAEFALWNNQGADIYSTKEYDKASYLFYKI